MKSRATSKTADTRTKILDATLESLSDKGIEKTTLQTIAKHAKLGVSHVAYHFPNKHDLIREAIHFDTVQYTEVLEDFLKTARTPEEKLRAFLKANFHWHQSKRHRLTWLLEFYLASQDKSVSEIYAAARAEGRRRIQEYIGPEMIRRGLSYEELEREAFSVQMLAAGFLTDYIARYPLDPGNAYVEQVIEGIVRRVFQSA
jgi:TetR/AcrR family transcriptional repressor of bet genes